MILPSWLDFVTFQITWWLALASALGYHWSLPFFGLGLQAAARLYFARRLELSSLAQLHIVAGLGFSVDLLAQYLGILSFYSQSLILPHAWLFCMWVGFIWTWQRSFHWLLKQKVLVQFSLGALGFPLSYWPGQKLAALNFADPTVQSLLSFGCLWGVALPILTTIYLKLDTFRANAVTRK